MRRRNESEEQRVEQLLARLWRRIRAPTEHELSAMARAAAGEPRAVGPKDNRRRGRWTLAVAAVALLLGSGLGFSLGSSVTPSVSAGTSFVGFGFLPARGWTVVQSGAVSPAGAASAIAANVSLHPDDDLSETPYATLQALPARGVLIFTTFAPRGDPGEDFKFPVSGSPLQIANAEPVPSDPLPFVRRLGQYRLRAGVGGYNVDARIYFGTVPLSAKMLAAAQRQLNRLVVASERVTIAARPAVVPPATTVTLFGSVDNGAAGETVDIQAKDCGQQFFRVVAGATTVEGGGWSTVYFPAITTTLRAVWNGVASTQVTVRQRALVQLRRMPSSAREFEVWVVAKAQFWRKQVLFQRFDRRLGTWRTIKTVVLTEQRATGFFVSTRAKFKASIAKGTVVRVVLPLSQARPCYLAGTSLSVRV